MKTNRSILFMLSLASSLLFPFITNAQTSYCTSASSSFSYKWIKRVSVGSMNNPSLGSLYSNFTVDPNLVQPASVQRGSRVSYELLPGFSSSSYREEWAIFIDFDGNGSFLDPGEKVVAKRSSSTSPISGTFPIPLSAQLGTTRMRVSMQYRSQPPPCGVFGHGEVEDYSIVITEQQATPTPIPPTPRAFCTPPPCSSPNTLQCPTASCPGGCGYACVPPTPTVAPPTPTPTAVPQCTPPPCSPPNTLMCPTGNCVGGCGVICSTPHLAAGSFDASFGTNGAVLYPVPGGITVSKAVVQPDDKILLGGVLGEQTGMARDENRQGTLFVSRFLQNGSPDLTFGTSGSVVIHFGINENKALFRDLLLQPDGKFVVLAEAINNQNYQETYLWRYTSNGVIDSSFGNNGRSSIYPVFLTPQSLAIQGDGKLLVGGDSATSGPHNLRIVRLHSNGALDSTFGINGEYRRPTAVVRYTHVSVTSVGGQERIAIAALTETTALLTLIRLTSTGVTDITFGTNGIATHTVDPNYTTLRGFAVAQDGSAFSFGESMPAPTYSNKFYLARTRITGSLDETFGAASGIVHYPSEGFRLPRNFTVQTNSPSSQSGNGWPRTLISIAGPAGARVERLSEIGAPDLTFGSAGRVVLPEMTAGAQLLKVLGGSRLLVVGTNTQGLVMYRLGL